MASLYPELVRAGSLSAALDEVLIETRPVLRSTPNYWGYQLRTIASVSTALRSAQVFTALDERKFGLSMFEQTGLTEAGGWAAELSQVASAIVAVLRDNHRFSDLVQKIPFLEEMPISDLRPFPRSGERLAYIEEVWQQFLTVRSEMEPDDFFHRDELPALIRQASQRPELRRLLPYTSLWRFSVAMRLHPPGRAEKPVIWPLGDGRYALIDDWTGAHHAEGDASVVLDVLIDLLPGVRH